MLYCVKFKPAATKSIEKLPKDIQKGIITAIESLSQTPRPLGVKKLHIKDNLYRIRVGNYRVIYTIKDREFYILITLVKHRKDAYK